MHHQQPAPTGGGAIPSLWVILGTTLFSLLLVLSLTTAPTPPPAQRHPSLFPHRHRLLFNQTTATLAYLISGSANDSGRVIRLLYSVYHPRNQYLLHLDRSATQPDRDALALTVQSVPLFRAAQNVHVVGNADYVYPDGPSALSSALHGASVLLRLDSNWDWFINLSAAHYPLITQDDLLHILSYLPRDLNFVNHTGYIGWRESRKLKPIIVDPALYLTENSEFFFATQKRPLPDAFRLFTGIHQEHQKPITHAEKAGTHASCCRRKSMTDYSVWLFLLSCDEYDPSLLDKFHEYDPHNAQIKFEMIAGLAVIALNANVVSNFSNYVHESNYQRAFQIVGIVGFMRKVTFPFVCAAFLKASLGPGDDPVSVKAAFRKWLVASKALEAKAEASKAEEAKKKVVEAIRKLYGVEKQALRKWADETKAMMEEKKVRPVVERKAAEEAFTNWLVERLAREGNGNEEG